MESLELSSYPPAPIVWSYNAVDTVCQFAGCEGWREVLPTSMTESGAWFSSEYKLEKPVSQLMPPLLTYHQFLTNSNTHAQHDNKITLESFKTYAFETPSTALADVTTSTSFPVLVVLVLIIRTLKGILMPRFSKFGRNAAIHTHGKAWEAQNEERIFKFGEYVFRLLYHIVISVTGIYIFWNKEWWLSGGTPTLWLNYPNQPIETGMIWYYLVQCAYNIEAMINLLEISFTIDTSSGGLPRIKWSKDARGDFREMFVHHVVTNMLVIGSSFFRFTRAGSMVFLVHDISDIPVDLSKLANFLKWKMATVVCFVSMCLVWMATRLGIFPFKVYRSVIQESLMVCTSGVINPIYYVHYQPFFVVLIGLLLLLHTAWFGMFIKMGYVLVSKGETHDLSEHKKGEEQNVSIDGKSKAKKETSKKTK